MISLTIFAATALTAVHDSYPVMSPDGSALLFHSNRSGRQAIWVANGDGGKPRLFFDRPELGSDPGTPVWSPDGRTIVFAMRPAGATDENESEIYVMDANASGVRRLTNAPGDDSHPHWSADGKRIFFNSARATPDLKADWTRQWIDIYSMAADGSDVRRHTDCQSTCTYPVPSPDGRFVVHRRTLENAGRDWEQKAIQRNSEVFVTPLDGRESLNVSKSPAYDGWPIWSRDGRWIVFSSNRDGAVATGQLYRVRPDGSGLARVTKGPFSHVQPSFSPDGEALLVYRLVEWGGTEIGQIANVPFDGGEDK